MRELVFATTNPAKVEQLQGVLKDMVTIVGINSTATLPEVIEDCMTGAENARKKALTYASYLNQTVLSMDNSLYIVGLKPEEQPGLLVRRPPGTDHRLNDSEMIEYYSKLVEKLGGSAEVSWDFAICIANPEGKLVETVIKQKAVLMSTPCKEVLPGYPLDSLLVSPFTRKYVAQESKEERAEFWRRTIGQPLQDFIRKSLH